MPETDGLPSASIPVSTEICRIKHDELSKDVRENKETIEKLNKIILGNGGIGLVEKVNVLMMKNQWLDKGFGVVISILSTLLTLWIAGVLHL